MIALERATASIGGRVVFSDLSFDVRPGEIVALCGPNGAGKSSAIRAACGLLPVLGGQVRLGGDRIDALSQRERAARVAYLPQERRIAWNMPAVEIAALGLPFLAGGEARDRALAALSEVGAGHLGDRGVAEMSGGERARVLIARTLATGAAALALDEPVAGLDPDAQFLVMDRLRAHAEGGQGVLISLHDLGLAAAYADRVVVLYQGRVVADGPPREALSPILLRQAFSVDGDWIGDPGGEALHLTGRRSWPETTGSPPQGA
ncbi:MAG: ABC transporter ATP-binding protein [Pseudomonadota bacterium]